MFPPISYLAWARQHFGDLAFDLASSGTPPARVADLGEVRDLADPAAQAGLSHALSARYGVPTEEIVPCLGTTGGLFVAYGSLLSRGDAILVEDPAYEPLVRTAEALGLRLTRFSRTRAQSWALDPDTVARCLAPDVRAVVVSHLHNPTGVAATDEALLAIAGLLAARGGHLIVDEVYGELVAPRKSARTLAPNIVAISSLTKCFGLGFLRAGWVFLPREVAARAEDVLVHVAGHLPSACYALAEAGVLRADTLADRRRALMAGKRARVDAFIASQPSLSWVAPHAGSVFGFVHQDAAAGDLRERLERGCKTEGVLAVPGEFFGDCSGFRLGFTLPDAKLDGGLERLGRVLAG